MYRIYEKVPQSQEYEYGMKLLDEETNPFKEGPCLLSMIALAMWEKDINGAMNYGMEALRLQTNHNENSGIGLNEFDGKILSLSYGEPSDKTTVKGRNFQGSLARKDTLDEEFTQKYLFPLIEENGKKIDTLQAMRNIRNINLLTYCGATQSALKFEQCLADRMSELDYSKDEIAQILSQMCVIGYATDVKLNAQYREKRNIQSTCLSFGDVNDGDVGAPIGIQDAAKQQGTIFYDEGYYFHYGNGEHGLKNYLIQNDALSLGISSVLTKALSNSILNQNSPTFKPLSQELLTEDLKQIVTELQEDKKKQEITPIIDEKISYTSPDQLIDAANIPSFVKKYQGQFDKMIRTSSKNKDNEELILLRKIDSEEVVKGMHSNNGIYYIFTSDGEAIGRIDVIISNSPKSNKAEIQYKCAESQRNKGNTTISLDEVLKDIFINQSYNNLPIKDIFPLTNIEEVFLAINSDNGASQAVAKKMGFQANGTTHIMTKEMFMQKYNSMSFSESNIGHVTDSSNAELKNNAQKRVQSDIEQDKSKDDSVTEISQS